uniref:Uncharacterized protein n=1 Tax=Arundo donax TaxID=35708 RepID=A0A0A9FYM8_ARUDO
MHPAAIRHSYRYTAKQTHDWNLTSFRAQKSVEWNAATAQIRLPELRRNRTPQLRQTAAYAISVIASVWSA